MKTLPEIWLKLSDEKIAKSPMSPDARTTATCAVAIAIANTAWMAIRTAQLRRPIRSRRASHRTIGVNSAHAPADTRCARMYWSFSPSSGSPRATAK
jgi:hypothetical protein